MERKWYKRSKYVPYSVRIPPYFRHRPGEFAPYAHQRLRYRCEWGWGKRDGVEQRWRKDGGVLFKREWVDGVRHGKDVEYHKNKTLKVERFWDDGGPIGPHIVYYKNGNVKCSFVWEHGKRFEGPSMECEFFEEEMDERLELLDVVI